MNERHPFQSFLHSSRGKTTFLQPTLSSPPPPSFAQFFQIGDPLWIQKGLGPLLCKEQVDEVMIVLHHHDMICRNPVEQFCCMMIFLKAMYFPSDFEWLQTIMTWGAQACNTTKTILRETEMDMILRIFTSSNTDIWLPLPASSTL